MMAAIVVLSLYFFGAGYALFKPSCIGKPTIYDDRGEMHNHLGLKGDNSEDLGCVGGSKNDYGWSEHRVLGDDTMNFVQRLELWTGGHFGGIKKVCIGYGEGDLSCHGKADGTANCAWDFLPTDRIKNIDLYRNDESGAVSHGDLRFGGIEINMERDGTTKNFQCGKSWNTFYNAKDVEGKQIAGFFGATREGSSPSPQISQFAVMTFTPTCKIIKQEITKVECAEEDLPGSGICRAKFSEYGDDSNTFLMYSLCDACDTSSGSTSCTFKFSRTSEHAISTSSTDIDMVGGSETTVVSGGVGVEIKGVFSAEAEASQSVSVNYAHTWEESKAQSTTTSTDIMNSCTYNIEYGKGIVAKGESTIGNMVADLIFTVETTTTCDHDGELETKTYNGKVNVENVAMVTAISTCKFEDYDCDGDHACRQYADCESCYMDAGSRCAFTAEGCMSIHEADTSGAMIQACPIKYCKYGIEAAGICCRNGCTQCGGEGCDGAGGCCQGPIMDAQIYCESEADTECLVPETSGHQRSIDMQIMGMEPRSELDRELRAEYACVGVPTVYHDRGEELVHYTFDGDDGNWGCCGGSLNDHSWSDHKTLGDDTMDWVRRIEFWTGGHFGGVKKWCTSFGSGDLRCHGNAKKTADCTFDFLITDRIMDLNLHPNTNGGLSAGDYRLGGIEFNLQRDGTTQNFQCGEIHHNYFTAKNVAGKQFGGFFGGLRKGSSPSEQISQLGVLVFTPSCKVISQKITKVECANPGSVAGVCDAEWLEYGQDDNVYTMLSYCDACHTTSGSADCSFVFSRTSDHTITTSSTEIDELGGAEETTIEASMGIEIKGIFKATGGVSQSVSVNYAHSWENSKAQSETTRTTVSNTCTYHIENGAGVYAIGTSRIGNMVADLRFTIETKSSCDHPDADPTIETYDGTVDVQNVALVVSIDKCEYNDINCNASERCKTHGDCKTCKDDDDCVYTASGCISEEEDTEEGTGIDCPIDYCAWGVEAGGVCCGFGCTGCGGDGCDKFGENCCQGGIMDAGRFCTNSADTVCLVPDESDFQSAGFAAAMAEPELQSAPVRGLERPEFMACDFEDDRCDTFCQSRGICCPATHVFEMDKGDDGVHNFCCKFEVIHDHVHGMDTCGHTTVPMGAHCVELKGKKCKMDAECNWDSKAKTCTGGGDGGGSGAHVEPQDPPTEMPTPSICSGDTGPKGSMVQRCKKCVTLQKYTNAGCEYDADDYSCKAPGLATNPVTSAENCPAKGGNLQTKFKTVTQAPPSGPCGGDECCVLGKAQGAAIDQDRPNKLLHKPQPDEFACAASCTKTCKWWTFDMKDKLCTLWRDGRSGRKVAGAPKRTPKSGARFISGPNSCKPQEE